MKKKISIFLLFSLLLLANNFDFNLTKNSNIPKDVYKIIAKIKSDNSVLCNKSKYNLNRIRDIIFRYTLEKDKNLLIELQSLLNSSFNQYLHDINFGCLKKEDFVLLSNNEKKQKNIQNHPIYLSLIQALNRYIQIKKKNGWEKIEKNFYLIKPKDKSKIILKIKNRLKITGDYECNYINELYDECLEKGVKKFQRRHGLKADGIIGPKTLAKMNETVDKKIQILKLNIERIRWLLENDENFVIVNIPDFSLSLYISNKRVLKMKAIIGRKDRQTPILKDYIKYSVLNPYWRAPKTIVKEDILPKLKKKEFEYFEKKGIYAALDWDGKEIVDIRDIDWTIYNDSTPYVFMQEPGPNNFLGFVKFIFPNSDDIYIHDTPDQNLFNLKNRALSSGCVRVEKPIELLYKIYQNEDRNLTYRKILKMLIEKRDLILPLKKPFRVYIFYMTAFVDENGVNFRDDIYDIDRKMIQLLNKK